MQHWDEGTLTIRTVECIPRSLLGRYSKEINNQNCIGLLDSNLDAVRQWVNTLKKKNHRIVFKIEFDFTDVKAPHISGKCCTIEMQP